MKVLGIKEKRYGDFETCLKRQVKKKVFWEWDLMGYLKEWEKKRAEYNSNSFANLHREKNVSIPTFALNVAYNTLDASGLHSYIQAFEKILLLNPSEDLTEFPIKWLSNEAEFKFEARRKNAEEIVLDIRCKNKYRLTYDEFDMGPFGGGSPDFYGRDVISEYNGKPDEYCKMGQATYPEASIREYLEDLITEYEDATGEAYERLTPKPSKLKFWKK